MSNQPVALGQRSAKLTQSIFSNQVAVALRKIILSTKVTYTSGLLEGGTAGGRRLAQFNNLAEVKLKEITLRKIIKTW